MEKTTTLTRSPYEVLGINRWSSDNIIKQQYYTLTRRLNPEYEENREQWIEIRKAYETLIDSQSRAAADVKIFTGPPPFHHSDHPDYQQPLSLFKLNQELKAITGEDGNLQKLQSDQREQAIHILHGIALYHVAHNQYEDARNIWKQIQALTPQNSEAEENLALSLWQEGFNAAQHEHYDKAEKLLQEVVNQGVEHGATYQDLALAREKQGKKAESEEAWKSALTVYKKNLKEDPDNEYLKSLILAIHKYTGGKFLESGVARDYSGGGSAKELGYACIQKGNWKQAVEALEQAHREHPNDLDVMCQLGWAYLNTNAHQKAFQMWNTALKKSSGKSSVVDHLVRGYTVFGKRLKEQRIFNQALVQFKNAIKFEPNNLSLRMHLAETFFQMKNYSAAVNEYQRILDSDPRHKEARQGIRESRRLGGLR